MPEPANNQGQNGDSPAPSASGGGASALDLHDPKDRAAMRTAMERWPGRFKNITEEKRNGWVDVLDDVIHIAHTQVRACVKLTPATNDDGELAFDPTETQRKWCATVIDGVRTITMLDKINHDEQMKQAEWDRIDSGKATGLVDHRHAHAHMNVADPKVADALWQLHEATKGNVADHT